MGQGPGEKRLAKSEHLMSKEGLPNSERMKSKDGGSCCRLQTGRKHLLLGQGTYQGKHKKSKKYRSTNLPYFRGGRRGLLGRRLEAEGNLVRIPNLNGWIRKGKTLNFPLGSTKRSVAEKEAEHRISFDLRLRRLKEGADCCVRTISPDILAAEVRIEIGKMACIGGRTSDVIEFCEKFREGRAQRIQKGSRCGGEVSSREGTSDLFWSLEEVGDLEKGREKNSGDKIRKSWSKSLSAYEPGGCPKGPSMGFLTRSRM